MMCLFSAPLSVATCVRGGCAHELLALAVVTLLVVAHLMVDESNALTTAFSFIVGHCALVK